MEAYNIVIASLDVLSLFTDVPLEEVVKICLDLLYKISRPTVNKLNF